MTSSFRVRKKEEKALLGLANRTLQSDRLKARPPVTSLLAETTETYGPYDS
jgi:hypothetical protein